MDAAVMMEMSAEAEADSESDVSPMRSLAMPTEMADPVEDTIFVVEPVEPDMVTIEYESLTEDGFVVIMSLPKRDVVGVSDLLPVNETGSTTIANLTLTSGGLYTAVLYQDTNTDGAFDLAVDRFTPNPAVDSWTEFIEVQFLVSE